MTRPPALSLVPEGAVQPRSVDDETLDDCFREHAAYVAAIALKLLGRDAEVDDVVQEVFLAAWRGMAALREPGSRRGWLATVAVRRASRRLRTRRIRRFFGLDAEVDYERLCVGASQEDAALLGQVYRILDSLPVELRMPWVLQRVEGEPLERVALYCECSLATAKRRIAAAQAHIDEEVRR